MWLFFYKKNKMANFKNIFGTNQISNIVQNFNWITMDSLGQINEIIDNSEEQSVLIFKHSTRCSVSRMALKQFENEFKGAQDLDCYFLDLIKYREISNEISQKFSVTHQSPQVLIIKSGTCTYNVSHSDIVAASIIEKI